VEKKKKSHQVLTSNLAVEGHRKCSDRGGLEGKIGQGGGKSRGFRKIKEKTNGRYPTLGGPKSLGKIWGSINKKKNIKKKRRKL